MNKTKLFPALLALGLTLSANSALAAEGEDQWRFGVTVPLWAAGIDGDVTVRGNVADLDIGFDDLSDHLDAALSLGFEARRGKLGLFGGFGYLKFSGDHSSSLGTSSEAEFTLFIADAGVSYQLLSIGDERRFVLEGIAGVRYWHTDTELEVKAPGGATLFDDDHGNDLVDPIIGLRASQYLTRKLHLDFAGDIGGFGVSDDSSDFAWSAAGLISYDFTSWFTGSAGYRALALDKEDGSGASKNGVDIIMHGLLVSAKFNF